MSRAEYYLFSHCAAHSHATITPLPSASHVNAFGFTREANLIRRIAANALVIFASFAVAILLLEAVVRVGGETDADGQFTFLGFALEPYALQASQLRAGVQGYIANKEISAVIYDEKLGWTYRPNSQRQGGAFTINGSGFRAERDYRPDPPTDSLRIALFGDSFTAGDDVGDDEVWSRQLETMLNERGFKAEVLNFGVGAYGVDQAFLRWREQGKDFAPDIVIFGLQPENLARNLNVFRQLMHGSGPPFSKPRFVVDNGELELVNSPTLPPEQLIAAFEDFGNHPLAAYEHHYESRYMVSNWWATSRLASLVYAVLKPDQIDIDVYERDTEGGQLGRAIIDAFARDVAGNDAEFVVAHLPLQWHLQHFYQTSPPQEPPFQFLLDHCRDNYVYIATEAYLGPEYAADEYWTATKHYGPEIHALIADAVAQGLIDCLESGACDAPRFGSGSNWSESHET